MSSAAKLLQKNLGQKGQGIIEIIVVILIASLLITALIVLSLRANRSADFSKVEDQAARLAQEGLEIIRSMRDYKPDPTIDRTDLITIFQANCSTSSFGSSGLNWTQLYLGNPASTPPFNGNILESSGACSSNFGKNGYLVKVGDFGCNDVGGLTTGYCLHLSANGTGNFEIVSRDGREFQRVIYVADTPTSLLGKSNCNETATDFKEIKQFTSEVIWFDSSGPHTTAATACINRFDRRSN